MFPKYRGKLFEDENLKITENQILGLEERQNAFKMRLGHAKKMQYAPRAFAMRPVHAKSRGVTVFSCFRNG